MNIFITGATSGIGFATAKAFAKEGHHIFLGYYRDSEETTQAISEIKALSQVTPVHIDISDLKKISQIKYYFKEHNIQIDVLVNNAGVYDEHEFFESTPEIWSKVIDTNLRGTYFMTQAIASQMVENKTGVVINVASVAGVYPRRNHLEYAISKAGIIHMTKCLAQALAPIRVNAVAPSYTWSKFMSFMDDKEKVEEKVSQIPLGRFNEPEDVAHTIVFLASEKARNITGEVVVLDGGRGGRI